MVQALSINNDNYKMGNKGQIYKIWYKIDKVWYELLVHDYLQDLQAIQEVFTSFIKVQDWLEQPREQADGAVDGKWMDERYGSDR